MPLLLSFFDALQPVERGPPVVENGDAGAEGRVERGEAELLLPDRDVDVALCGFRLLAESYPEYVSYKEMNDYGK